MPPKEKKFSIVSWYNGNMVLQPANMSIQNVLNFTDDELESRHDFIQLLFPLPWPSKSANKDVVPSVDQLRKITGPAKMGQNIRRNMLEGLKAILAMFDLELTPGKIPDGPPPPRHRNGGRKIRKITPSPESDIDHEARAARLQALANPGNHHHHRFTRIIRSLRVCGRGQDAESVYRFLRRFAKEHPTIPQRVVHMWGVAANSKELNIDPRKEIKNVSQKVLDGEESGKDGPIVIVGGGGDDGGGDEISESGGSELPPDERTGGGAVNVDDGGDEGGDEGGDGGSTSNSSESDGERPPSDGGGFGPGGGDTPPPEGGRPPNGGRPPGIGDPKLSEEEIAKLTPTERELHHARIQHMGSNRGLEILLDLRNADGIWIGADEDPMKMTLIELRVWQLVLRDLVEQRRSETVAKKRIEEGREPDSSSFESSDDDDDPDDDREFLKTHIRRFGQPQISAEDLQKLEPWELKLHHANVEHTSDYHEIEVRFKYRNGEGIWRGNGSDPITLSLRKLKEWQIEMDKRQANWMDEVMRGKRQWSEDVSSESSFASDYEIGAANMSEEYFASLGAEDQERHYALIEYTERFRRLEYELGFRDRTTYKWIAAHMDPYDMNLDELDQWIVDMEQHEEDLIAKQEAEEAAAAEEEEEQSSFSESSPEAEEMEELMAERVKRGLDPLGDSPEAERWKALMAETEKKAAGAKEDGPETQLQKEARARRDPASSSRSKRRRVG
ncbi:hypothetical protein V492_03048 [Pseudogymnoascus sp. VKM F-4246]|nr:hypothetical protein V492_03048 [Pseudogymnoascus sp. VKM F-4246]